MHSMATSRDSIHTLLFIFFSYATFLRKQLTFFMKFSFFLFVPSSQHRKRLLSVFKCKRDRLKQHSLAIVTNQPDLFSAEIFSWLDSSGQSSVFLCFCWEKAAFREQRNSLSGDTTSDASHTLNWIIVNLVDVVIFDLVSMLQSVFPADAGDDV